MKFLSIAAIIIVLIAGMARPNIAVQNTELITYSNGAMFCESDVSDADKNVIQYRGTCQDGNAAMYPTLNLMLMDGQLITYRVMVCNQDKSLCV